MQVPENPVQRRKSLNTIENDRIRASPFSEVYHLRLGATICQNRKWEASMETGIKTIRNVQDLDETILKTVSALANYGTGRIILDLSGQEARTGLSDPDQVIEILESRILENIHPEPSFSFVMESETTLVLSVEQGKQVPYCYGRKAYKPGQNGPEEVSQEEYRSLVQKRHLSFMELPAETDSLTFRSFEKLFTEKLGITMHFPDTLITLGLCSLETGYTNSALLLSDQNTLPGILVVEYAEDCRSIQRCWRLDSSSVLDLLEQCAGLFVRKYTGIIPEGHKQRVMERIPVQSFNEALIRALVYREWDVSAWLKVEFFPHQVMITSPSGLPEGITIQDYLSDRPVSFMRNRSLVLLFLVLGLIQNPGSGTSVIRSHYSSCANQPEFQISERILSIILPEADPAR